MTVVMDATLNDPIVAHITTRDSQIVRAKGNLKLGYGGPSQRQASGTNQ